MNVLNGIIEKVTVNGSLSLVSIRVGSLPFTAIVIDTPETTDYLEKGADIKLMIKESEVIISTGNNQLISLQNRIKGKITSIESGKLLSRIILETEAGNISSVITSNAVAQLQLKVGKEAIAMIKTNEIMLSK